MKLRSKFIFAGAVSSTVLIGGAAFAYWSASGSGGGTATAGTPTNVVLTGDLTQDLYPGASLTLTIKARNSNPGATVIGPVRTTATFDVAALDALCPLAVSNLVQNTELGGDMAAAVAIGNVTVTMANSAIDQSACIGRPVTLVYATLPLLVSPT